jgi:hypothetical protein
MNAMDLRKAQMAGQGRWMSDEMAITLEWSMPLVKRQAAIQAGITSKTPEVWNRIPPEERSRIEKLFGGQL